jgi:hypothetical protein
VIAFLDSQDASGNTGIAQIKEGLFKLTCYPSQGYCVDKYLILPTQTGAQSYEVAVEFVVEASAAAPVNNLFVSMETATDGYIIGLIAVRYGLLFLSVVLGTVYGVFYFKTNRIVRTFEHTMILILSISLIFFNDPLAFLTLTSQGSAFSVISAIVIGQFFGCLVFLWLGLTHKMRYDPNSNGGIFKTSPVSLVAGSFFLISLCAFATIYVLSTIGNLSWSQQTSTVIYNVVATAFLFSYVSAMGLILLNAYHILRQWKCLSFRNRFILGYSAVFPIFWVFLLLNAYSHIIPLNRGQAVAILVSVNLYVFFLQVLWRFTQFALDGSKNEIDSFAFNRDDLKIDSFDIVALKDGNSRDFKNQDAATTNQSHSKEQKIDSIGPKNDGNGLEDHKSGADSDELWAHQNENWSLNRSQPRIYATFEDSPHKSPPTARVLEPLGATMPAVKFMEEEGTKELPL